MFFQTNIAESVFDRKSISLFDRRRDAVIQKAPIYGDGDKWNWQQLKQYGDE